MTTTLDQVYRERNTIACALARMALEAGCRAGVMCDPTGEEPFDIAVIIELPTGRVGWHLDGRDPARPWAKLPAFHGEWCSFTSEENWGRVARFLEGRP